MKVYDLFWSPTGARIATITAKDARAACRKAPRPYRKYLGEIYAESPADVVVRHVEGIYRVEWSRALECHVTSIVNGCTVAVYRAGAWLDDEGKLPDRIRAAAEAVNSEFTRGMYEVRS